MIMVLTFHASHVKHNPMITAEYCLNLLSSSKGQASGAFVIFHMKWIHVKTIVENNVVALFLRIIPPAVEFQNIKIQSAHFF